MTAYASPLLRLPGAVPAEEPDAGVALHYGDPLREQRRLSEERRGFVDLSHRDVLRVGGPDRLSWLHSLTTQHLTGLCPGDGREALVLSPHGHVEHALFLVDDGEATWIHVEPGTGASLLRFLDAMRFMLRVEVTDVTPDRAVVWEPVPEAHPAHLCRVGERGRELLLPRADLEGYAAERGDPGGMWAYEALRVEAGVPRLGRETDHRTIPHEVGWLRSAVHLDKGCYRGQETVARVQNLGRPPRRLVLLHLDGSVERLPTHGDPVMLDGRPVGFLGTAARHWELGPVGLAVVKRNVPVGSSLEVAGIAASQEAVVAP